MDAVLVDIDDTLINTDERRRAVWQYLLKRDIPSRIIRSKSSRHILRTFAPRRSDLWRRFWRILLCIDDRGRRYLNLDKPLAGAVDVMMRWRKTLRIAYITGRTENMRDLTLKELEVFGFPVGGTELLMCTSIDDFLRSAVDVRRSLLSRVFEKYSFLGVVDDNPLYFPIYREFHIPVRIGFVRAPRYSPKDFREVTNTIFSWRELDETAVSILTLLKERGRL